MSVEFTVEAVGRQDVGKGASRRLRREKDYVPGIVYGGGKDPQNITMSHNRVIKWLENEAFFSHILTLDLEGKQESVVLKAIQRHPAKHRVLHMDFLRVKADQKITMHVPIHFLNEDTAPGVKAGGVINHMMTDFEVQCLPKDLPEFIEVDLGALELDEAIHVSHIPLPKGITLTLLSHGDNADPSIASIHVPKVMVEEPVASEVKDEELEAAAEGEEGSAEGDKKSAEDAETKED